MASDEGMTHFVGDDCPGGHRNDPPSLETELAAALNRHSAENASNTPDFILAQYLLGCLAAWNTATQQRETWYGRGRGAPQPHSERDIADLKGRTP